MSESRDIVVYTRPDVLDHKRGLDHTEDRRLTRRYWEFSRPPKSIDSLSDEGARIYFAVDGVVLGSFEIDKTSAYDVEWSIRSWRPLAQVVTCKPFRGFRYRWWTEENR